MSAPVDQLAQALNPWLGWLDAQLVGGVSVLAVVWTLAAAVASWAWAVMWWTSARLDRDRKRSQRNGPRRLYTQAQVRLDRTLAGTSLGALLLGLASLAVPRTPGPASPARALYAHLVGLAFTLGMAYFCYVALRSWQARRAIRTMVNRARA